MKHFITVSHRRSGSNLLTQNIRQNFDVYKGQPYQTHETIKWNNPILQDKYTYICIIREGMDCVGANYNYWCNGGEGEFGMNQAVRDAGFKKFLRGDYPPGTLNNIPGPHRGNLPTFVEPVKYWVEHTKWKDRLFTVYFHDLVNEPEKVLISIAEHYNMDFITGKPVPFTKPAGPFGKKTKPGANIALYDEEDIEYFQSQVE